MKIKAKQDHDEIRVKKPTQETYNIYNMSLSDSQIIIILTNLSINHASFNFGKG